VIASAPELAVLIIERLPGAELHEHANNAANVHRAAGRFLAALHQLEPSDGDPLPLAEALPQRIRAWLPRAPLEPGQLHVVEQHGPRPELFATARRVACHRDFAPRNWLWDGETLGIVDFEHARPDLALVDLAKLCVGSWAERPDLAAAFFGGYGRMPSDLERKQLRALVVLHGVASLAWGHARADADLVSEGRRALAMAAVGELGF
jgi:Ser/Thr protein kinase RdoA (MazF antagonist)